MHQLPDSTRKLSVKRQAKVVKALSTSIFQKQHLYTVAQLVSEQAKSLPSPTLMSLPINSLLHDFSIRNSSETQSEEFYGLMIKDKWQSENSNALMVNKVNSKFFVFNGNNVLKAKKKYHEEKGNTDPKFEMAVCNVFDNLHFNEKVLIANQNKDCFSQKSSTVIQKVSFYTTPYVYHLFLI